MGACFEFHKMISYASNDGLSKQIRKLLCFLEMKELAISDFQKLSVSKRGKVQNLSCRNEFYSHGNKKRFHINGFALGLAFKQRLEATQQ